MSKKVSFDFDGTLARKDVQEFASLLISKGIEVEITTARCTQKELDERHIWWYKNDIVFEIMEEIGIEKVTFTSSVSKSEFLKEDIIFHLDDDNVELEEIIESGIKTIGVDVKKINYQEICLNILGLNQISL